MKIANSIEILRQPFDIEIHKKKFINYLEVIVDEEGTVHYAVPSHQEWLIQKACRKLNISREGLYELCPPEYYFDVIGWLTNVTGCVAVWGDSYKGKLNEPQYDTLKLLESERLFTFPIKFDSAQVMQLFE